MAELGTALAFASLSFQLFSGCIQGYQLLSDASGMPKEFQYLRVAIKTEESRLLNWAYIARLDEREENLLIAQANKQLLLDVLEEQRKLLMRFGKLDEKYRPLSRPLIQDVVSVDIIGLNDVPLAYSEDGPVQAFQRSATTFQNRFPRSEKLLSKALQCVKSTQKYPAGLKWATFDREAVEQLVHRLKAMNDYMESLLTQQQLSELLERQTRTEFQILQLNDKVDQLLELVGSSAAFGTQSVRISSNPLQTFLHNRGLLQTSSIHGEQSSQQRLGSLAKTKAFLSAIETNTVNDQLARDLSLDQPLTEIMTVELDRKNIHLAKADEEMDETERVEAFYTDPKTKRRQQVWIEWKFYDPQAYNGNPDPKILERLKALTTLLKENKHSDKFHAPHCLGYFRDWDPITHDDFCRFGLVFETPSGIPATTKPKSLLSLLQPETPTPSLTARISLCHALSEIVEKLHAVDWVHKGLRSHNILFFPSPSNQEPTSLSTPYISGFDYSRPAQNEDLTEKPPENPAKDIYRHPSVHGSAPPSPSTGGVSYKKTHDIYSLGIVFLEIAFWSPIHSILNINLSTARPSQTLAIKSRLLNEPQWLGYVKSNLGDRVWGVVSACLEGGQAFGLSEGADEGAGRVKEELQCRYYDVVVRRLGEVRV